MRCENKYLPEWVRVCAVGQYAYPGMIHRRCSSRETPQTLLLRSTYIGGSRSTFVGTDIGCASAKARIGRGRALSTKRHPLDKRVRWGIPAERVFHHAIGLCQYDAVLDIVQGQVLQNIVGGKAAIGLGIATAGQNNVLIGSNDQIGGNDPTVEVVGYFPTNQVNVSRSTIVQFKPFRVEITLGIGFEHDFGDENANLATGTGAGQLRGIFRGTLGRRLDWSIGGFGDGSLCDGWLDGSFGAGWFQVAAPRTTSATPTALEIKLTGRQNATLDAKDFGVAILVHLNTVEKEKIALIFGGTRSYGRWRLCWRLGHRHCGRLGRRLCWRLGRRLGWRLCRWLCWRLCRWLCWRLGRRLYWRLGRRLGGRLCGRLGWRLCGGGLELS
jgi:hypothetical protein